MNKPRPESKLLNLPEEQQAQLAEWLLSGMPYHEAKVLVQKEFGVSVSLSKFSAFWAAVCSPALLAKRARAVNLANDVADQARKHPGKFDEATIDALKQKAFELASSPNGKPKDVKALFALVLKAKDQEAGEKRLKLDERKVAILEKKAAAYDKAKEVFEAELSPDEQKRRLKEILA